MSKRLAFFLAVVGLGLGYGAVLVLPKLLYMFEETRVEQPVARTATNSERPINFDNDGIVRRVRSYFNNDVTVVYRADKTTATMIVQLPEENKYEVRCYTPHMGVNSKLVPTTVIRICSGKKEIKEFNLPMCPVIGVTRISDETIEYQDFY